MDYESIRRSAALICTHVLRMESPILFVFHTEPAFPEDSGWQFLCGQEHEVSDGKFCTVEEVVAMEPSVKPYLSIEHDCKIYRLSERDHWIMKFGWKESDG